MALWRIAEPCNTEQARATFRCVITLFLVILAGTTGFFFIEKDWSLWQSLYFTLITITTVGYSEQDLSRHGQMFAAVLLLCGIGTATYTLTSLAQIATDYRRSWRRRMQQKFNRLSDHYLVCGFGRMGMTICEELHRAGKPLLIIDTDTEAYNRAIELGYLAIHGSADDEKVLQDAGVDRARGVVCATASDAENVFITLCIRERHRTAFIACRASCDNAARRMSHAGASLVVSPYSTAGLNVVDAILRPGSSAVRRVDPSSEGQFELSELQIGAASPLYDMSIGDLERSFPSVVLIAVGRGDEPPRIGPPRDLVLQDGDAITVAGRRTDLDEFLLWEEVERTSAPDAAGTALCPTA